MKDKPNSYRPAARRDRKTSNVHRRRFLATAAAGALAPYVIPGQVLAAPDRPGANERIRLGVVGTGNRVRELVLSWCDPEQAKFVALAECNAAKLEAFVNAAGKKFSEMATCAKYVDYREMFDKEKLDGVFITTPTHGRVLPCIHACQAGVDIYAEKPVTLTIAEGQVLIRAVKKHDRVFQAGTQARSIAKNHWAVQRIRDGALGKVTKVLAPNFDGPVDYRPATPAAPPSGINWDLWCNQAPLFSYDPTLAARLESGWAPYREFDGGGDRWGLTGFGTHAFDQILWGLAKETESPVELWPNKPGDSKAGVTMRFADGIEIEMMDEPQKGPAFGGIFVGADGKMEVNRDVLKSNPVDIVEGMPKGLGGDEGGINHVRNWIDCIRTRNETRCPVEVAHRQTVICHAITVTRELGRKLRYDASIDRFVDDDEANRHPSVVRERRKPYELPSHV